MSMKQLSRAIRAGNEATAGELDAALLAASKAPAIDHCNAHGPMLGLHRTQVGTTKRTHLNQQLMAEFLEEKFNGHGMEKKKCIKVGNVEVNGYTMNDVLRGIAVIVLLAMLYLMMATRNIVPAPRQLRFIEAKTEAVEHE